jgi:hypothetical protein
MGYIKHHAIIVTSDSDIDIAYHKAIECGNIVTNITDSHTNRYSTFVVIPDGSKEGWQTSIDHDYARNEFIEWLKQDSHEYGYNRFEWAELTYGSDDESADITNHAWRK